MIYKKLNITWKYYSTCYFNRSSLANDIPSGKSEEKENIPWRLSSTMFVRRCILSAAFEANLCFKRTRKKTKSNKFFYVYKDMWRALDTPLRHLTKSFKNAFVDEFAANYSSPSYVFRYIRVLRWVTVGYRPYWIPLTHNFPTGAILPPEGVETSKRVSDQ